MATSAAPDRVQVKPTVVPDPFVLTVREPVRTFKVSMTAKAKGNAGLSSTLTAISATGTEQSISTSTNLQVYPAGDLLIKGFEEPATAFGGNDVYQTVANGPQLRTATSGLRDTNRFSIRVENDSREAASFVLRVNTSDASKWHLGLKYDGLDITAQLLSPAGWPTPMLEASGALEVVLQAESVSAEVSDRLIVTPILSSTDGPEVVDTVSAIVKLVAVPVQALMKHADASGYKQSSIDAGKTDLDAPLELVTDRVLLDQQPSIFGGWVADGVTPLLLKFRADDTVIQPFPDGRKFALEITVDSGGELRGQSISKRLRTLNNGVWTATPSFRLDASTTTAFGLLTPIRSDDVQLSSARQLKLLVIVKDVVADLEAGRLEIPLRKPPIALIHGYNTGGDWADSFTFELSRSRPLPSEDPGWISTARYGQSRASGRAPFVTQWENTLLPLATLAPLAGNALEDAVAPLRNNWAFTRFDVICHSQGGLLTRMLCSERPSDALPEPFRNAVNHFRGRFHRVVTIGSPHNGTRLLRYLLALNQTKLELLKNNLPALIGRVGVLSEVAQAKFDPFGREILDLNNPADDSRWKPDPDAKFHLIRTTINLGQPPYVESLALSYSLLGLDHPVGGPRVLPRGSDGVVDFDSMAANGPGQPLAPNVFTLDPTLLVSHAPTPLFGALFSQTESSLVAAHAIAALDQDPSLPESQRTFSRFVVPTLLGDEVRQAIDAWADQSLFEFLKSAINPVPPPPTLQDATDNPATPVQVVLSIPANLPNTNAVSWFAELYSANGIESMPGEPTIDKVDSRQASVRIPGGLVGDVVLFASYKTTNGAVVLVEPRRIYSAEPAGVSLVGVDVDPSEITLPSGGSLPIQLWTRYSDGQRVMRRAFSSEVTVESSSPEVVSTTDPLEWKLKQPGQSTLTVSYRGQKTTSLVTVTASGTQVQPVLQVAVQNGQVVLAWPTPSAGFILEQAASIPVGSWTPVLSTPAIVGQDKVVTLPTSDTAKFYRLRLQ